MRIQFCPLLVAALVAASGCAPARHPSRTPSALTAGRTAWPGRQPDGSVLLPNQWSLRPTGRQVELADFPINVAVHPGGQFAAVLHSGFGALQVVVVDLVAAKVVARAAVPEAFYGVEFSRDGKKLFCSGAGEEVIHAYDFRDGALSPWAQSPNTGAFCTPSRTTRAAAICGLAAKPIYSRANWKPIFCQLKKVKKGYKKDEMVIQW
ncbi:MAG: hypothetical protein ABSF95_02715 [Verrucomicrobiota bacterium]|jgi:hypothetical protein